MDVAKLQNPEQTRQVRLQRIEAMLTAFGLYERKPKRLFGSVTTIRSATSLGW
jgi:endonuclease III